MSITKYDITGTLEEQLVATQDALNDVMDEHPGFITSFVVGEDNIKLYNGDDAFFKIHFDGELGHRSWDPRSSYSDIDDLEEHWEEAGLYRGYGNLDGISYIVSTNHGIVVAWNASSPYSSTVTETLWVTKDQNGGFLHVVLAQTRPGGEGVNTGKIVTHFWSADPPQYTNHEPFVGAEAGNDWYKWFQNGNLGFTGIIPVANLSYQQTQYSPYLYFFKYVQLDGYVCKKMTLNGKDYFTNGMLALLDGPAPTD